MTEPKPINPPPIYDYDEGNCTVPAPNQTEVVSMKEQKSKTIFNTFSQVLTTVFNKKTKFVHEEEGKQKSK